MSANAQNDALLNIVSALTEELEQHAVGSRKARFEAINAKLKALKTPTQSQGASWLGPLELSTTGWSLLRDERRLMLSSSLDNDALHRVFSRVLSLL